MNADQTPPIETIQIIDKMEYPAEIDRYKLIYTPTGRFFIIDLKKITESITPKNE